MNNGYIKLYRSLKDWEFYGMPNAVTLWIHILITANWEDGSFRGEHVPRGTMITSVPHLATDTGLAERTVRRWLKKFETSGMIAVTATNRWTRISVLKYSTFQDIPERQVTRQMAGQVTSQMTSQVAPNRRIKEEKEEKNNSPLNPPKGRRAKNARVVIEPPEWYKRQQAGETDVSDADPEETEALIAEIEDMKRRMNEQ